MILRRLGNKSRIAKDILQYFPKHSIYIETFFGAGGMFFNKPQVAYNLLNDADSQVYNCFNVLRYKKQELTDYLEMIPYHVDFWNECKTRTPDNDVEQAVYFLVLSNFGFMGQPEILRIGTRNEKTQLLKNIELGYKQIVKNKNRFLNCDFRDVLSKCSLSDEGDRNNAFLYSDPPYLDTTNNYNMPEKWNEIDVTDCFDVTFNSGLRAAMSEFNHPFVMQQAKERNLNVLTIGERKNLGNRKTEILITNYEALPSLF